MEDGDAAGQLPQAPRAPLGRRARAFAGLFAATVALLSAGTMAAASPGAPSARPGPTAPALRTPPAAAGARALPVGAAVPAAPAARTRPARQPARTATRPAQPPAPADFDFAHKRSDTLPEQTLDQYRDLLDRETLAFTIAQAVEVATVLHPEVRRRREQLAEYPSLVRAERAEYLPQLDLTLQAAQTRDPGFRNSPFFSRLLEDPTAGGPPGFGDADPADFGGAFTFGTYLWNFDLRQTVWSFRFRPAMRGVELGRDLAATDLAEAENRIARDTATRLYAYLLGERTQAVLESALGTRERSLELAQERLELGAGARLEVLRERVAVSRLRRQLADADEALRVERAGINALVGREQDREIEVLDALELPDPLPRVLPPAALMEIAGLRRPQLRRHRLDRDLLTTRRELDAADALPVLRANASYGINTFTVENTYDLDLHNWNAGVTLTWNLFDGLGRRSRAASLRSQQTQSEWEQNEFESTLEVFLHQAAANWNGALAALEEATLALEEAAEAQRVAEAEREAGAGTAFFVQEAEQARREVELELARNTHDALAALAEMKFLVGYPAHAPHSVIADASPVAAAARLRQTSDRLRPTNDCLHPTNDRQPLTAPFPATADPPRPPPAAAPETAAPLRPAPAENGPALPESRPAAAPTGDPEAERSRAAPPSDRPDRPDTEPEENSR